MSILVRFTAAPGMTAEKYDDTLPLIEASGEWPPDGLEYHVAFSTGGDFRDETLFLNDRPLGWPPQWPRNT